MPAEYFIDESTLSGHAALRRFDRSVLALKNFFSSSSSSLPLSSSSSFSTSLSTTLTTPIPQPSFRISFYIATVSFMMLPSCTHAGTNGGFSTSLLDVRIFSHRLPFYSTTVPSPTLSRPQFHNLPQ